MLLDGEWIDRPDRLQGRGDPFRFDLERLEVEVEHRGGLGQLVERALPLGLDPLHDQGALGAGLGHAEFEAVVLLAHSRHGTSHVGHVGLDDCEPGVGRLQRSLRLTGRRLECDQLPGALVAAALPFDALGLEPQGVGIEAGDLLGARASRQLRLPDHALAAGCRLAGRPEPGSDVCLLHLPLRTRLARLLQLGLQLGELGAAGDEGLVEPPSRTAR